MSNTDNFTAQIERLIEADIEMQKEEAQLYCNAPDILSEADLVNGGVPVGYKKCGRCKVIKKFYLFNRNASSKINCTGNCKECQSKSAQESYGKNKGNRDYKQYYADNRDMKREQSKKYYASHRDQILSKQKKYRQTEQGRETMNRSHSQRKKAMKTNKGIPYTREMVIDRDSSFIREVFPICYLCNKPIENPTDLHMEHLISIVIGGSDCFTNVGCAHSACNLTKSKAAEELTVEQVETIEKRSEAYIEAHPDLFPDF